MNNLINIILPVIEKMYYSMLAGTSNSELEQQYWECCYFYSQKVVKYFTYNYSNRVLAEKIGYEKEDFVNAITLKLFSCKRQLLKLYGNNIQNNDGYKTIIAKYIFSIVRNYFNDLYRHITHPIKDHTYSDKALANETSPKRNYDFGFTLSLDAPVITENGDQLDFGEIATAFEIQPTPECNAVSNSTILLCLKQLTPKELFAFVTDQLQIKNSALCALIEEHGYANTFDSAISLYSRMSNNCEILKLFYGRYKDSDLRTTMELNSFISKYRNFAKSKLKQFILEKNLYYVTDRKKLSKSNHR